MMRVILAADILGLLASLMLVMPALAASTLLRQVGRVRSAAHGPASHAKLGRSLATSMESHLTRWHAWDHWLLVGGTLLLCLSFAVRIAAPATS